VSPISVGRFFSPRAQAILASEFIWIWIPATLLTACALTLRRRVGARDQRGKGFANSQ
jgi:hypothetical protein